MRINWSASTSSRDSRIVPRGTYHPELPVQARRSHFAIRIHTRHHARFRPRSAGNRQWKYRQQQRLPIASTSPDLLCDTCRRAIPKAYRIRFLAFGPSNGRGRSHRRDSAPPPHRAVLLQCGDHCRYRSYLLPTPPSYSPSAFQSSIPRHILLSAECDLLRREHLGLRYHPHPD